ncbi:hypothetical protein FACS1894160_3140 [Bacteroidia bacterium]|nr:hypothetical protein FACS1894123_05410 [Bacteroidia bacterium]GHV08592.1 hypothetical protein FACS1894160_3140 [Bacteroidia bacterium]
MVMKKIYTIIFAITFPFILNYVIHQSNEIIRLSASDSTNQHISPIQKQVGKLTVSIDPRIELLSAIQASSDYEIIQRNNSYYNHIKTYFTPFTHLQAISSTNKLARIGFSYDAPVQFMLYLTQPNECKPHLSYSDYLINRAQGDQQLIDYQNDIHEFAVESKFNLFWKKNESFYEKIVHLSTLELDGMDWISALEGNSSSFF